MSKALLKIAAFILVSFIILNYVPSSLSQYLDFPSSEETAYPFADSPFLLPHQSVSNEDHLRQYLPDQPRYIEGEFIVKFSETVDIVPVKEKNVIQTGVPSLDSLNEKYRVTQMVNVFKTKMNKENDPYSLSRIYRCSFSENLNVLSAVEEYQKDVHVEYVQPNYIMTAYLEPNDPYYHSSGSWGQPFPDLWGMHTINANRAWDITTGSQDIIVAVIDTGVDYTHEDIHENMWINTDETPGNGIDDDDDGFVDNIYGADYIGTSYLLPNPDGDPLDGHGHGSHCAGIIGAVGNNWTGVVGVTWKTKIMAVKGLDDSGIGSISDLAAGIIWAADNGAMVISNSWGPSSRMPSDPVLEGAVRYADTNGCVVVFAAGNNNDDVRYYCPANMDEVLAVAATDYQDKKAYFSNWGDKIDVCAPGVDVLSLRGGGTDIYGDGSHIVGEKYYWASGTSMACPHVAGLAALLLSHNQSYTPQMIRDIIKNTADQIESSYTIGGRINAFSALALNTSLIIDIRPDCKWTDVHGVVSLVGSTVCDNFTNYSVSYGKGNNSSLWTNIVTSYTPILDADGILAEWDTTGIDEGLYRIRLEVVSSNKTYYDSCRIIVNNLYNRFIVNNVSEPGVDYIRIQDAINDSGDRDTVYIQVGSYREKIDIVDRSIEITGEDKTAVIIWGGSYGIHAYADSVNINNLTIQMCWEGIGIFSYNVFISDVIISDIGNYGITIYSDFSTIENTIFTKNNYGIRLLFANNNTINNCTITENVIGIFGVFSQNNIFSNTIIERSEKEGVIWIYYSDHNIFSRNTIRFNNYTGASLYWYSNYNTFACNIFEDNKWGTGLDITENIWQYASDNNLVFNNTFINNYLQVYSSKDNTIIDNFFLDGSINLGSSSNNTILNNTLVGSLGTITVSSSIRTTLIGNSISASSGGYYISNSYQNTVSNNLVRNKPLVYFEEESNQIIDRTILAGQIILFNCSNITIQEQEMTNVPQGIELQNTIHCRITDSTMRNCDYCLLIVSSTNTSLINNTISDSNNGCVIFSDKNTIVHNSFFNAGLSLFGYHNVVSDNTVNGKPLMYYEDQSSLIIDTTTPIGGAIFVNCTNMTIRHQQINNTVLGIEFFNTDNSIISDNSITQNKCGILFYQSSNNLIYNNYFNNSLNALALASSNQWNISKTLGENIIGGRWLGGNYWSDYEGVDSDGDGFGETPYDIMGGQHKDYRPLVNSSDLQAPLLNVTAPETGFFYIANIFKIRRVNFIGRAIIIGKIAVTVDASDNESGINRVEFIIDNVTKATITEEPYTWLWNEWTPFNYKHAIKIVTYDNAGNTAYEELTVWKIF